MTDLKSILKKYCSSLPPLSYSALQSLTTNLQKAGPHQIAFYRLKDSGEAEKAFKERYSLGHPGLVIVNRRPHPPPPCSLVVRDPLFMELQRELVDFFFPLKHSIHLMGITGTDGKTSTAWLVGQILKQHHIKGLVLGTLGLLNQEGEMLENLEATTPDFIDLRRILYQFQDKMQFLALEVSSHGLDQDRPHGLQFDGAAWTNFSQDHLDYHSSMEEYFKAKCLLRNYLKEGVKLWIPPSQQDLMEKLREVKMPYGPSQKFEDLPLKNQNPFFQAEYNRDNLSLAYTLAKEGFPQIESVDLKKLTPPRGRFEVLEQGKRLFIIDYAHTPAALEKLLSVSKKTFPHASLWVVFGCGGDRDKGKRPQMGAAAHRWADHQVLTSDNPRFEDPEKILDAIAIGCPSPTAKIVDRREAIEFAFKNSLENDLIVIAGKGHENYQDIQGQKMPFDDRKIILKL